MWKVPRFLKDEKDYKNTVNLIKKHFYDLKDIFIGTAVTSDFPDIGWMDMADFIQTSNIIDDNLNLAKLDLYYIATNVEM